MRCFFSNSDRSGVHDGVDFGIDDSTVTGVVHPFPLNEKGESFDEDVAKVDFSLSNSIGVGYIPDSSLGIGVNSSHTSGLELHFVEECFPVLASGNVGELGHASASQTSSEVGRAGEHETEMVVVHEVRSVLLHDLFDFIAGADESSGNLSKVLTVGGAVRSSSLHGDNSKMIFFSNPDEKGLTVVVENTSGVGPVSSHA